jgi:pimeloyl-ACP methyl ester carboxylesterase
MSSQQTVVTTHHVEIPSGRIGYASAGCGPVALFVHGVVLNKHLWRHQLAGLSDIRRCIAVDLLAHGDTEITPDQDVSVTANAKMLKEALDALKIDQVDLIGNDSGGGIAQIFAALNPERVRTLTLTNCDTHDNWPPEAFQGYRIWPSTERANSSDQPERLRFRLIEMSARAVRRTLSASFLSVVRFSGP